jgi:hypothetical protein
MAEWGPGRELRARVIAILRADATLALYPTGLVYSDPVYPRVTAEDTRIYASNVELPENPALRAALPRVLVEVLQDAQDREQRESAITMSAGRVYIHVIASRTRFDLAELIQQRCHLLLLSTPLSSARILAGDLTFDGTVRPARETALDDAHRLIAGPYSTPHVGVTV